MGKALNVWEHMESHLGKVFSFLCGGDVLNEGAVRAYGLVVSSTTRIEMLREAYTCFPNKDLITAYEFPRLLNTIGKFGARRNEIAHGMVTQYTENQQPQGHFLVPARYNSRKNLGWLERREREAYEGAWVLGNYAYNSNQIDYYRSHFEQLSSKAFQVQSALYTERFKHPDNDFPSNRPSGQG